MIVVDIDLARVVIATLSYGVVFAKTESMMNRIRLVLGVDGCCSTHRLSMAVANFALFMGSAWMLLELFTFNRPDWPAVLVGAGLALFFLADGRLAPREPEFPDSTPHGAT